MKNQILKRNKKSFWNTSTIKDKNTHQLLIQKELTNANFLQKSLGDWKENIRLKKYQLKNSENMNIWELSEQYNTIQEEKFQVSTIQREPEKPNLRHDFFKEMLGFKLKKLNKSGTRTPKELWQRVKYLSKGLTLDEWADRVESSWENMLEYSEKLWENFFIYSFKKYPWYSLTQKLWSDSWYGQNWKNWRREEETVTWQTNSRTPWNKHIRLSNDQEILTPKIEPPRGKAVTQTYTFPKNAEMTIGANRLKLNNQIFSNTSRHELIKQGAYNSEFVENIGLNAWEDSAQIYLKYIRPWFLKLNFLDKPFQGNSSFKYLGREQHKNNYNTIEQKNVFQSDLYKVSYNLKLIKQLNSMKLNISLLERKYGKRNVKMYQQNKDKYNALESYERLLHFRQTNQNLITPNFAKNPGFLSLPQNLNKNILNIYFLIFCIK